MPTLALAGGTSPSLGRAIVTAILEDQRLSAWNLVILSRSSHIPTWLRAIDPDAKRHIIHRVDYRSTDSLAHALQGVHTVVSVTSATDGTQATTQINLLDSALSAGCKRFAPSRWGLGCEGWEAVESLRWLDRGVREHCSVHKDEIEIANFNCGGFMNYIGLGIYPSPEPARDEDELLTLMKRGGGYVSGEDEASEGLQRGGPLADGSGGLLVGLRSGIAELPVKPDGTWPRVTLTTLRDVGRFVAASLELPNWEEEMDMVGETLTMGDLLGHAEAVAGRGLEVQLLTPETIGQRLSQLAPDDFARFWFEMNFAYTRDRDGETVLRPILNGLCPDVNPMGVREYMERCWR